MKNVTLFLLSLLMLLTADLYPVGVYPIQPNRQVLVDSFTGSFVEYPVNKILTLQGYTISSASGTYHAFVKNDGVYPADIYKVPTGKKLKVLAIKYYVGEAANAKAFAGLYSTTDATIATYQETAPDPFLTPCYDTGEGGLGYRFTQLTTYTETTTKILITNCIISAGQYPIISYTGATTTGQLYIDLYGYEY